MDGCAIAIETVGLGMAYGDRTALEHVSLRVASGEAVALVGPNGAGKTTLLRVLATLLRPTAGYARVLGLDGRFQAARIRRVIGYMPDSPRLHEGMEVGEYLEFYAALHGLEPARRVECVRDLAALLDLGPVLAQPAGALSRGMQQRVCLARTLVHDPQVLLLDEPAANLDPRSRVELREVLRELRRMGKTIVVSSHVLADLEPVCTRLVVLDGGHVRHEAAVGEGAPAPSGGGEIYLRLDGERAALRDALGREPGVERVAEEDGGLRLWLAAGVEDYSGVLRRVLESGARLRGLREERPGLQDLFLRWTDGGR